MTRTVTLRLLAVTALLSLAACTGATGPTPSPTPAPISIVLGRAPADLGCDAMAPQYGAVTIKIDPRAATQVTALTDTGLTLDTFWSEGFVGGTADDPVVRDAQGDVVARDGEGFAIPQNDWPRLHGYFVCPSQTAIYVLLHDPQ